MQPPYLRLAPVHGVDRPGKAELDEAAQVVVAGAIGLTEAPTTAIEPGRRSEARSVVGDAVGSGMSVRSVSEGWGRGQSGGLLGPAPCVRTVVLMPA